jgi:hypothetical protein
MNPKLTSNLLQQILEGTLEIPPKMFCGNVFLKILSDDTLNLIVEFFDKIQTNPLSSIKAKDFLKTLSSLIPSNPTLRSKVFEYSPQLLVPFLFNESKEVQSNCKHLVSQIAVHSRNASLRMEQRRDYVQHWGLKLIDLIQTYSGNSVSFVGYIETWETLTVTFDVAQKETLNQIIQALELFGHYQRKQDPNIEALLTFAGKFKEELLAPVADEIYEKVFGSGIFQHGEAFLRIRERIQADRQRRNTGLPQHRPGMKNNLSKLPSDRRFSHIS